MQVQVINAFTRKVCERGEWVMPEAPDPAVGLTPTSREKGLGEARGQSLSQGQTRFPTSGSLNQAAP